MLSRSLAIAVLLPTLLVAQGDPPKIPADVDPVTTDSGLVYSVLEKGDGERRPAAEDAVTVRYTGWLPDGTVFDTTERDTGAGSARFLVGQVIPGWSEGLQQMTVGSVYKFTIPSELGYGERGAPPQIPPNATLVFRVELLEIDSPPEFRLPGDDAKRTEGGVTWTLLDPGSGDEYQPEQAFSMRYAVFTNDGRMLDATFMHGGRIEGRVADMNLPFLAELPLKMRPGAQIVARVPADQGFAGRPTPPDWGELPDGESVWRLWLDSVHSPQPVPDFRLPDPEASRTTDSGLVVEELRAGSGESPQMGEPVRCHYAGWLTDGTLFDSSYPRGLPLTAPVGRLVPGWNEALMAMKPGALWRIRVPAQLGYGERGRPPKIPGGADLVFQVELLEVVDR